MDNAVALVQAYLRVNGYFTVAEYPVIEAARLGGYQTRTDLDILALRFPGAGRMVVRRDGTTPERAHTFEADPALGATDDRVDMLIGEVKEGKAELNEAARDPLVLRTVLARFGCCPPVHAAAMADELLRHGMAVMPSGHRARLVAFGSSAPHRPRGAALGISLGHVVGFLEAYIREHWGVVSQTQFKDPALGFLVTLEKARRDREPRTGAPDP